MRDFDVGDLVSVNGRSGIWRVRSRNDAQVFMLLDADHNVEIMMDVAHVRLFTPFRVGDRVVQKRGRRFPVEKGVFRVAATRPLHFDGDMVATDPPFSAYPGGYKITGYTYEDFELDGASGSLVEPAANQGPRVGGQDPGYGEDDADLRQVAAAAAAEPKRSGSKPETRTSPFLEAYGDAIFFPLEPKTEDLRTDAVAHALSQQCRFAGSTKTFFSVAQHAVLVALDVWDYTGSVKLAWGGLHHDDSESALVDLPSPLKMMRDFAFYRKVEENYMRVVFRKAGLPEEWAAKLPDEIVRSDMRCLYAEKRDLMGDVPWAKTGEPLSLPLFPLPPPAAKQLYLDLYNLLWRMMFDPNGGSHMVRCVEMVSIHDRAYGRGAWAAEQAGAAGADSAAPAGAGPPVSRQIAHWSPPVSRQVAHWSPSGPSTWAAWADSPLSRQVVHHSAYRPDRGT